MGCSIGLKRVKGIICVQLFTIGTGIQLNSFRNKMGHSYFGQNKAFQSADLTLKIRLMN